MLADSFRKEHINHWNTIFSNGAKGGFRKAYHQRLRKIYSNQIPSGVRILEIGCSTGSLLSAMNPKYGVGIDFSKEIILRAQQEHPENTYYCLDVTNEDIPEEVGTFDFIILSDLLNDVWDVQTVFEHLKPVCHKRTRIIINIYSRLWQPVLTLAQGLGLARKNLQQNWLTSDDIANMLYLAGFEVIKIWQEVLLPAPIPGLNDFFNKFLVKVWPFHTFALANFLIARPQPLVRQREYSVSVIVPARNEAGNIKNILDRIPEMGLGTEIVFVEGNSTDATYQTIVDLLPQYSNKKTILLQQDGKGKGDAVRKGFAHASGEILMILDADLTVPPEDLPRFYEALTENKGEFINGVRLVYPMEKEAMRFFNFLGNKFFSLAFSYLLGQPIKDTLCGTKVLFKSDYELIVANRAYFGEFDPFGDYDLIFGAARLGLKIVDLPIRYRERTYGSTNIQRWSHGWLLIKMVAFAAGRIKYI
jgi:ubiquinone/menaquinone biosynthesis C-methylase UbiE